MQAVASRRSAVATVPITIDQTPQTSRRRQYPEEEKWWGASSSSSMNHGAAMTHGHTYRERLHNAQPDSTPWATGKMVRARLPASLPPRSHPLPASPSCLLACLLARLPACLRPFATSLLPRPVLWLPPPHSSAGPCPCAAPRCALSSWSRAPPYCTFSDVIFAALATGRRVQPAGGASPACVRRPVQPWSQRAHHRHASVSPACHTPYLGVCSQPTICAVS